MRVQVAQNGGMTQKPDTRPAREFRGTGLYWSLIGAVIVVIVVLIGIVANLQSVEFRYVGVAARLPLSVILLITIAATAFLTAVVGALWRRRRRRQLTDREELLALRGRTAEAATPGVAASPSDSVPGINR